MITDWSLYPVKGLDFDTADHLAPTKRQLTSYCGVTAFKTWSAMRKALYFLEQRLMGKFGSFTYVKGYVTRKSGLQQFGSPSVLTEFRGVICIPLGDKGLDPNTPNRPCSPKDIEAAHSARRGNRRQKPGQTKVRIGRIAVKNAFGRHRRPLGMQAFH